MQQLPEHVTGLMKVGRGPDANAPSPRLEEEASGRRRVRVSFLAQSYTGSGVQEDTQLGDCLAGGFLRHQCYIYMDLRGIASVH